MGMRVFHWLVVMRVRVLLWREVFVSVGVVAVIMPVAVVVPD
jgi:hypothetical protein